MDRATHLYETFNNRPADREIVRPFLWPEQQDLSLLGYGIGISYRSDKVLPDNPTGQIIDYIHPDTSPVVVLVPTLPGYPPSPPPPPAPKGSRFALLGRRVSHCLEINYIDAVTGANGTLDFLQAPLLPWIAAHPDGKTLIVLYPDTIPLIFSGPGLQITEAGIIG